MPRLYRVWWESRWAERFIVADSVPSDEADRVALWLGTQRLYEWIRIWIENEAGEIVYEVRRPPLNVA